MDIEKESSPAMQLLRLVWREEGNGMGRSWARLNGAMQDALRLAITSGFRFDVGDFAAFSGRFNSSYWIGDGEYYYSLACGSTGNMGRSHGANPSAYQSYEAWRGRKPFIVLESEHGAKVRLHVGCRFEWHDGLKARVRGLIVTSFVDKPDEGAPYLVACTYKDGDRSKVDRRFKITHEDIKRYHAAVREAHKKPNPVKADA